MKKRKGIILAGGKGTRLYPLTQNLSKQLLPVYDKPMIYYAISVLMMANIKEILIITKPSDQQHFKDLLGDGSKWGINFYYIEQPSPEGLAQAYILGEDFLEKSPSVMILGDNLFFGNGFEEKLIKNSEIINKSSVFCYQVKEPKNYGVVGFNEEGRINEIIEKPLIPPSNYALTGLYFLDESAPQKAKEILPSSRGELEIVDLLDRYLNEGTLNIEFLDQGYAWLDMGTFNSLIDAGNFVRTITERQGLIFGSPEELAFKKKWISKKELKILCDFYGNTDYGFFLKNLLKASDN